MAAIIQTNGLCKQYGKILRVKDLDLSVPEGAVYGFLGPNGAGKSTTLKMILGLAKPTAGSITVFEKTVNSKNRMSILKNVGSLIESPSYYGHLSGHENLQIICTLKSVPEKEIERVLQIVRLEKQKDKKVSQYSLGMKQRLGLACALLGSPKLLILDEPTNGLDPAGIQEMRELICSLPKEYGMTVLVSSHLLSEIDQMATNVGIISKGELIFQSSLAALHQKSSRRIAIRTLDNARAASVLQEQGIGVEMQQNYLLLPELDDPELARHTMRLFERNVQIVRIEQREKSLEDIFLELTGRAVSL
ncbi:ABC transporter ATP-binding protein [Desulforamulus ruminis]|uniref:ABC transporter related protein n=1 Tax=Desulforamulus ruminis (strain ATCC 23193 / DSM 2154 / NCIMB 8452 / DL) TaxID=696281 RepID=F6DV55_DESRL|nr:ATP-binding cassette domain-containing protein [Desulforamulus ruminis]AEG59121.1 ABC transporter related protein [Desulforamulus ruminis DSM 2154]